MVFIPCTCQRRGWGGWLLEKQKQPRWGISLPLSPFSLSFSWAFVSAPCSLFSTSQCLETRKSEGGVDIGQGWEKKWEEMVQKPLIAIPFVCVLSGGCSPLQRSRCPPMSVPSFVHHPLSLSRSRLFASSPLHFSSFGFLHFGHLPFIFLGVSGLLRPDRCGVDFPSTS